MHIAVRSLLVRLAAPTQHVVHKKGQKKKKREAGRTAGRPGRILVPEPAGSCVMLCACAHLGCGSAPGGASPPSCICRGEPCTDALD